MSEETKEALTRLVQAATRLREGLRAEPIEIVKDGVIQRFEFTFEVVWKSLKVFLSRKEGMDCRSPRGCLKTSFKMGIITDEQLFSDMLEDRNKTSHLYHKEESEEIYRKIRDRYMAAIDSVVKSLTEPERKS